MGGRLKFASQARDEALSQAISSLPALEPVLTIPQIAESLHIDRHVVTRLFAHERGVICIGSPETRPGKRKYRNLRVPLSVFNRVIARLSNK